MVKRSWLDENGEPRRADEDGYIFVQRPGHPLADRLGWVREHRLVAWDAGLFDDPSLHVHHRNEIKDDNRPENLEAMTVAEHMSRHGNFAAWQRAKTHCPAGHPYDEANTRLYRNGRSCKQCHRELDRARKDRLRKARRAASRASENFC